jgi:glycerol-3-phosphate cytidylyltransferase
MKKIITYGSFDLFHIGHLNILKRCRSLGDYLICGVSTDEFNDIKGKKSIFSYAERSEIIASISCVDLVISESSWDQKIDDIKKYEVSAFVMGDDWVGKFDYLSSYCEVIYLERTPLISSSLTKERVFSSYANQYGLKPNDE